MINNLERFIKYVRIDTQANDDSNTSPSSEKQKNLGKVLVEELQELGLEDAHMDEYGNVYAHLKGEGRKIGLNAHIDTALELTDTDVKPRIVKNYDGGVIELNKQYSMSPETFPSLKNHIGHDLVVTDGTTLLGADDKAGIAEIMGVVAYFVSHPEVKHHNISICFTCDEEIGRGPAHFDTKKMDAEFAYTLDGSSINSIDCENFNAKRALIEVEGVTVHPGEGRGKLVNSLLVLKDVLNHLNEKETPYFADENHGYWHLNEINGTGEYSSASMILRAFDESEMNHRLDELNNAIKESAMKYPEAKISLNIKDEYYNMKPYVEKEPEVIDFAKRALIKNGQTPNMSKIRGGTDGATFSKMGLPTPNLGTGSYNHHGRYEYLDVQEFEQMINIVIEIMKL